MAVVPFVLKIVFELQRVVCNQYNGMAYRTVGPIWLRCVLEQGNGDGANEGKDDV
ncbi:hypothetical protein ABN090_08135 [Providencia rettgeri]